MCAAGSLTDSLPFSQHLSDTPSEATVTGVQQPSFSPGTLFCYGSCLSLDWLGKASHVPR